MTTPGGNFADARIEATLDWGDLEGQIGPRVEKAMQSCLKTIDRYTAMMEKSVAKSAAEMDKSMGKAMTSAKARIRDDLENIRKSLKDSRLIIKIGVDSQALIRDVAKARADAARELENSGALDLKIKAKIDGTQLVKDLRRPMREAQEYLRDNPLVIRFRIDEAHLMQRIHQLADQAITLNVNANLDETGLNRSLRRMMNRVDRDANSMSRSLGGAGGILGGLGRIVGGFGSALGGVLGTLGKFASMAGVATVAAGAMVPVLAAAGAGLAALGVAAGGAAVAGLAAGGLAIATLKVGLNGFSDALSSMSDPEAFAEAIAKLSPAAADAALAFKGLSDSFEPIKSAVQESLFSGLADDLSALEQHLPAVRSAMLSVADGFNEGAGSALKFINSSQGASQISTILSGSSSMASEFGAALGNLVPALTSITASATNVFSGMTGGMAEATRGFSERMVELQQSGRMDEFFQKAIDVAKQLGEVLGNVGGIISGVFNAAQGAGGNILGTLGQVLEKVNEFVNSVEGQAALGSFFSSMSAAVTAILPVFMQLAEIIGTQVAPIIADLLTSIGPMLKPVLGALSDGIAALQPAIGPIVDLFASIATAITPLLPVLGELIASFVKFAGPVIGALVEALSPIIGTIGEALISIFKALEPAIAPISEVFAALSPVIAEIAGIIGDVLVQAVTSLMPIVEMLAPVFAQILEALSPLLPILGDALIQIVTTLAPLIESMAGIWIELVQAILPLLPPLIQIVSSLLPPMIQLIGALAPVILMSANMFSTLITAVMPVIVWFANLQAKLAEVAGVIIEFVATAIGKFGEFVTGVVDFITGLVSQVGEKIGSIKDTVTGAFDSIIETVTGLPARIADAASGMWDGIKDAFKGAVNFIIDGWNGIEFKIPGFKVGPVGYDGFTLGLPDIPRLKTGGRISGPGTGTSDSIIAAVSNGESINTAKSTGQYWPLFDYLNKGGDLQGFLKKIGMAFNEGGIPGAMFDIVKKRFPSMQLTSSYRAGDPGFHGQGMAADLSNGTGNTPEMLEMAEWIADRFPESTELIHQAPGFTGNIKNGENVGDGVDFYGPGTMAEHENHVHWAMRSTPTDPGDVPSESGFGGNGGGGTTGGGSTGGGSTGGGSTSGGGTTGGGSAYSTAAEAATAGVTPVWVENWPSGGSGYEATDTYTSTPTPGTTEAATTDPGTTIADGPGVGNLTMDSSKEEIAAAILQEAKKRGYTDEQAQAILSTGLQESGLDPNAIGGGGAWHGIFQQDSSYAGRDDPNQNIAGFMDRLDEKTAADPESDIWKRIFWLQQRPAEDSAEAAYGNGRQDYLTEIQSQSGAAADLAATVGSITPTASGAMPVEIVNADGTGTTTVPPVSSSLTGAPNGLPTSTAPSTGATGGMPDILGAMRGSVMSDLGWTSDPFAAGGAFTPEGAGAGLIPGLGGTPAATDPLAATTGGGLDSSVPQQTGVAGITPELGTGDGTATAPGLIPGETSGESWSSKGGDIANQALGWGGDAAKEVFGQFLAPIGLDPLFGKVVDTGVNAAKAGIESAKKAAQTGVSAAGAAGGPAGGAIAAVGGQALAMGDVNFNGMDPKAVAAEVQNAQSVNMTPVKETYRT